MLHIRVHIRVVCTCIIGLASQLQEMDRSLMCCLADFKVCACHQDGMVKTCSEAQQAQVLHALE